MLKNPFFFTVISICLLWTTSSLCAEFPVAKGRLMFDGQVLNTSVDPKFWFRDENSGKQVSARVEFKNGEFQIFNLTTGDYGADVSVDLNQKNQRGMPGDLSAWKVFSIAADTTTKFDINMTKLIHMTKPIDNGTLVKDGACEGDVTHSLSVKVAWDAVVEGAYYHYKVIRASCQPFKYGDLVASGNTKELSVTLDIPKSKPNEIYILTLSARKRGNRVGSMETHGANFRAWDYRFRVQ